MFLGTGKSMIMFFISSVVAGCSLFPSDTLMLHTPEERAVLSSFGRKQKVKGAVNSLHQVLLKGYLILPMRESTHVIYIL